VKRALTGIALGMLTIEGPAIAADLPVKARPQPAYDWSGFYLGAHMGYGDARLGPGSNALPLQGVVLPPSPTGLIGGYQAGYNWQLRNNLVLGAEFDATFVSPADTARLVTEPFHTTFDYFATLRGRVGYAIGSWLPLPGAAPRSM
jgi:high affinity Mn2+ porin